LASSNSSVENDGNDNRPTGNKMRIKVGTKKFVATLYDNATATAFKSLLPMTVNMVELNRNEKYLICRTICQPTHPISERFKPVI
jgi:hypothetical protein